MTKTQMIEAIQVAEARAWKQYSLNKELYGPASPITNRSRTEWSTLHDMLKQLGLPGLPISDLIRLNLLPRFDSQVA